MYLRLRKCYNFGTTNSRRARHVIPAQEIERFPIYILEHAALKKEKKRNVPVSIGKRLAVVPGRVYSVNRIRF